MQSLPANSLTLAEAAAHFGIAHTTLRDLIKNKQLPTAMERRASARGRRMMVVLSPDTLIRLDALLQPAAASPEPREPHELAIREVEVAFTPARVDEVGDHRPQFTHYVGVQVRVGRGRWMTYSLRLARVIRSPIAVWIVYAGRIVCACILYFLAPRAVAMAMMPRKRAINASNAPTRRRAA